VFFAALSPPFCADGQLRPRGRFRRGVVRQTICSGVRLRFGRHWRQGAA
jgi:hypothetical protein